MIAWTLLLACAAKDPAPAVAAAPGAAAVPTVAPMLPTPFTSSEIRDAFRPGQHLVFTVFTAGKGTVVADWVVTGWTDQDATIAFTTLAQDGATVVEPRAERTSSWDSLRDHASFPEASASRSEGVLVHPLGTLDIWLYTVRGPEPELVQRYWFAKDLPGPPVRFTIHAGAEEVFKMEQITRSTAADP